MKTDRDLQEDVLDALEWEPGVDAEAIGVSVRNGVVTLRGPVRSYQQKLTAERAASHVYGVRAVANDLNVDIDGGALRSDSALAEAVANALAWDSAVPIGVVKAGVSEGWVTLSGSVEWPYQRNAAEVAVRRLHGVKGVSNAIALAPHLCPADAVAP